MSDAFDSFVRQQAGPTKQADRALSLEKEKEMWLAKLSELYSLVNESLDQYIKDGLIRVAYKTTTLSEELLGSYDVQEAQIFLGNAVVRLKPIGTFLIGARGRVDMSGPRGTTRFTIVPPKARMPRVSVTIVSPGVAPPKAEPVDPPETWVWKIATAPPRISYIDLDKESFREALMGVVNG